MGVLTFLARRLALSLGPTSPIGQPKAWTPLRSPEGEPVGWYLPAQPGHQKGH
jgi:hypothetical protein